jgi:hypothetical protein
MRHEWAALGRVSFFFSLPLLSALHFRVLAFAMSQKKKRKKMGTSILLPAGPLRRPSYQKEGHKEMILAHEKKKKQGKPRAKKKEEKKWVPQFSFQLSLFSGHLTKRRGHPLQELVSEHHSPDSHSDTRREGPA